ncbi:TnsA endonuclease N-terminal domain-containing protein [Paenibacillus maysiensis]|uniref:TnsA endonuclease N-terminal domain-containing protein n=1 Tax=Paenibacillus maysiensis TaxID=1155954 RepID=UPI0004AFC4E0|nr:TnsA endonuclease N-terminal domain-containing protein [Paenibacillus maysiensis]
MIDVREQFPLNRELTLQIADQKQIRHPLDSSTQTPIVMTTDFMITIRRDAQVLHFARTVKPSDHLNTPRTIEKFEIEREYWVQRNVDWGIVTDQDLPSNVCRNIAFFHTFVHTDENTKLVAYELLEYLTTTNYRTLTEALSDFELYSGLERGEAFTAFKHLAASKKVQFDMSAKFSKSIKIADLTMNTPAKSQLRRVT